MDGGRGIAAAAEQIDLSLLGENGPSFVSLEAHASELRTHLGALQAELVDLINRDYADFVGLSTRLVDVDAAAARMRATLAEFRGMVATFRSSVDASLVALRAGLRQRSDASAAREVLELLLDTSHVISKVEKLIQELTSMHTDCSYRDISNHNMSARALGIESSLQLLGNGSMPRESETNIRESQSILLERIASEMNRLKFYISHSKNLPFIENMEKRIHSATSLLDGSLRHCFVDGLEHRDGNAIYNCLRAYAAIDNISGAEEIFRVTVVSPLIRKAIQHTDLQADSAALTNDLEEDYERIIQCIGQDCIFLLDISSSANSGLHVFDFLGNSILKEVLFAIQKDKPGAFSPGKPMEFLKNYRLSLRFLDHLEDYCTSRSAVAKFRSEDAYVDFLRNWNVGVYFSLRFQEVAGILDSSLTVNTISPIEGLHENGITDRRVLLKQTTALLKSLRSCWREDVFLMSSSDKFLRLSLQLISRYSTWLSAGLASRKALNSSSNGVANVEWAVAASVDDLIYIMHDVDFLVSELTGDFLRQVLQILESCPAEVLNLVRQSILQCVKSLEESRPSIMDTIIEAIVDKSIEDLKQMKGISATYRLTNKLPVRHSPYVSGTLRPLKEFRNGESISFLSEEARNRLLLDSVSRITDRYHDMASELVSMARKTESSLLRLRGAQQRRIGATSDSVDESTSNSEKICMQLFLDVQEYGRNVGELGLQAADIPAYRSLWQLVAPDDKQNTRASP